MRRSKAPEKPKVAAQASGPDVEQKPEAEAYSSDQPIRSKEEDRFNRWPFAERVARTLALRQDPSSLVVGIYAAWGDGKTSTLRLLEQGLAEHGSVVLVKFNPWHFQTQEQLLRGFFATLAEGVGRSLPSKAEEVGKLLKRYGRLLSLASFSVAGVFQISPGAAAEGMGEALSTVELDELRERLEKVLRESGKRVVVFIDDIDRLDRQEIQAMFKLVKLSGGFEHTSYVLAFDDEMVSAALGERYAGGGPEAGRNFLEKIVQVPLHLPPPDPLALRKVTFEGVDAAVRLAGLELSRDRVEAFVRHFVDGLEPCLRTPRQAKLYGNALTFALPILKGEVHPVDQMLIEGIRLFYPKLYSAIRDNPEYFLGGRRETGDSKALREKVSTLIATGLRGTGVDSEVVTRRLLQVLFPRLEGILGNMSYGAEWNNIWANEQRVSSEDYFDRYFRYAIPPGDVPDLLVARLIETARVGTQSDVDAALKELGREGGMRRLIPKLRRREEQMSDPAAGRLAIAVARNGALLPREQQMLISDWTFMQAGILVSHLTRQIPLGSGREALAERVVQEAEPLAFAFECIRWLRHEDKGGEAERILSAEAEKRLGELVAGRVREADQSVPLYRAFGNDAQRLYWIWSKYGEPSEIATTLVARFDQDPDAIDEFLASFVGRSWGMESGLSMPSDLRRETYDAIALVIKPEVLSERLKRKYGSTLDHPQFHHARGTPLPLVTAHQFCFIHQQVTQTQSTGIEGVPAEGGDA